MIRQIARNSGFLLTGKVGAGLLSLGYLILASRYLGPRDFGVLVLLNAYILLVGGIIGIPGWQAIVRFGAIAISENEPTRLYQLIRFAAAIEVAAGLVAVTIAALAVSIVGPQLSWPPEVRRFAVVYSIAVLSLVRTTPSGVLQLLRRFDLLALHTLVMPTIRLIGTGATLLLDLGLHGFIVVWLIAALAEGASMWLFAAIVLRRQFGKGISLGASLKGVRARNPGLLRFMLTSNADVTFTDVMNRIVPLSVGWMLGPSAAGLFSIAQRATALFIQPATIIGQASYAEYSAYSARGDLAGLWRTLLQSLTPMVAIGVIIFALIAWQPMMAATVLGGEAFIGSAVVLVWLALARLILMPSPALAAALSAVGHPSASVRANLISIGLCYPLLVISLQKFGLVGAGYHAVVQAVIAIGLYGLSARRILWR